MILVCFYYIPICVAECITPGLVQWPGRLAARSLVLISGIETDSHCRLSAREYTENFRVVFMQLPDFQTRRQTGKKMRIDKLLLNSENPL